MGVFKEQVYLFEEIMKDQKQIWADSCDVGVEFRFLSKEKINRIRESLKLLLTLPGSKVEYKVDTPREKQRNYKLIIQWGQYTPGVYDSTEINVSYFKNHEKEFIAVLDMCHIHTNEKGESL